MPSAVARTRYRLDKPFQMQSVPRSPPLGPGLHRDGTPFGWDEQKWGDWHAYTASGKAKGQKLFWRTIWQHLAWPSTHNCVDQMCEEITQMFIGRHADKKVNVNSSQNCTAKWKKPRGRMNGSLWWPIYIKQQQQQQLYSICLLTLICSRRIKTQTSKMYSKSKNKWSSREGDKDFNPNYNFFLKNLKQEKISCQYSLILENENSNVLYYFLLFRVFSCWVIENIDVQL